MDGTPQHTTPFAMNNADTQDAALSASPQILRHEILHVTRVEDVEVEDAVKGIFGGFFQNNQRKKGHRCYGLSRRVFNKYVKKRPNPTWGSGNFGF